MKLMNWGQFLSVLSVFILFTFPSTQIAFGESKSAPTKAEALKKLKHIETQLGRNFFVHFFSAKNMQKLYEQLMHEDHELLPKKLVTDEVIQLMKPDLGRRSRNDVELTNDVVTIWEEIEHLENMMHALPEEDAVEVLQTWRTTFLQKMVETMRSINLRRQSIKIMLSSQTQYDTNVNRIPDNVGTPANFSGKDDGQQLWLANLNWQPFVGFPNFNKNWTYEQIFNAVRLSQFKHKENEVAILDTESKLTRKFNGFIRTASLGYRFQNFYYSGNVDSRDTNAFFKNHRVRTELKSKTFRHNRGRLRYSKSRFSLSWQGRTPYDDVNVSQNANEIRAEVEHTLAYRLGSKSNASFAGRLEYTDYKTDNGPSFDYDYIKPTLIHKHSHRWKKMFYFKEEVAFRHKKWDQFVGGELNEQLISIKLQAALQPIDKLRCTLALKQNFKMTDQTSAAGVKTDSDADQFQVAFGLSWLM